MNDFKKIYDIFGLFSDNIAFGDTLNFMLSLNNIKKGAYIQDTYISIIEKNILEEIANKYNKYIKFIFIDIDNDKDYEQIFDDDEYYEVDILLSPNKIDDISILDSSIEMAKFLQYPVEYDLRKINFDNKNIKMFNFIVLVENVPNCFNQYGVHLFNFFVKDEDKNVVIDKMNIWLDEINKYIITIFPETYAILKIEDRYKSENQDEYQNEIK
jgi:hypothetical protein